MTFSKPIHDYKFCLYDKVEKISGYEYCGLVVSRFITINGKERYVVEHSTSIGMLHIFSPEQLKVHER